MQTISFPLYEAILSAVPEEETIRRVRLCERWAMAETETGAGLGMFTAGHTVAPLYPEGLEGLSAHEAAGALLSWNLEEASAGMAAVNAALNTPARAGALRCAGGHYGDGLDFTGKTVGMIGHMHGPAGMRERAKAVYILEREPREGDYPDAACDWLLPRCDIVILTGSSLINKTLPHLLSLCPQALTILTGPSVPLCPALLDCGLDRISGLIVRDRETLREHVTGNRRGSPFGCGEPFVLARR